MFLLGVFIFGNLLHCACSDFAVNNCYANNTQHKNCLVTENNTCAERCINPDLYEATGDNKKCIVKACTSYNASTCHLNDACVLTEQTPTKCMSSCVDFKVYLPVNGTCVISSCRDRKPKSMSVFIKINRVMFNYGYKTNNNVGVTVMGIQKNTSFYSGTSNQSDFNYTNETGLNWDNVPQASLENVRIQVYTDKQYFIGQAYLNISEYKTPEGTKANITVESGNVTIPEQNQTLYIEVGICTACASADWPCGDAIENEQCYQDLDDCSPTCTETDEAHYNPDPKTGICERVCEERAINMEDTWPCGSNYESILCYLNTGRGVGEPVCTQTCSKGGWYSVKPGGDRCELKECTARQADLNETHPCSPATSADCLYDPVASTGGVVCVESCPQDEAHTGDAENGKCVLACTLRTPNLTATHPCGTQCFFDPVALDGQLQCVEECPFDEKHTGAADSGRCVVGINCEAREANLTADFPCGKLQDCLFDPIAPEDGPRCVSSCTKDESHTGEIEQGACELVCELWTADVKAEYPCGQAQDCFYVPQAPLGGPPCVEMCPFDDLHTGEVENGWCVLACPARKPDPMKNPVCGRNCVFDPLAETNSPQCLNSCPKDLIHTGVELNGECLGICEYRKANDSATYPCGIDCYLDYAAPADNQCVDYCPVDDQHTGVFSGRCVVGLNCAARKADLTATSYPCKKDCFLDPMPPAGGSQCVEFCRRNLTHTGLSELGICSLQCEYRTADPTRDDPCGVGCFFDMAVPKDGEQCVDYCPTDEQHTGEAKDGICVQGTSDRKTKAKVSWWDEIILGKLARKWVAIIGGAAGLLILVIIIVIIVIVKKKKGGEKEGYASINSD